MKKISDEVKAVIKDAAKRLTGFGRRRYQAEITRDYFDGSARKAEYEMGWGRESVEKGLGELETGIRCIDGYNCRGRKKTEEKLPNIEEDIREIVGPHTQADPTMKSSLTYTRITPKAVRRILIDEKGYKSSEVPSESTIGRIPDRMGYNPKRVIKAKPIKKISQVDEIFENVREANRQSDENPESLRLSVDAKAKVNIGEFSRNGKSRDREAKKAADHDMNPDIRLVPYGISDIPGGFLTIFFWNFIRNK